MELISLLTLFSLITSVTSIPRHPFEPEDLGDRLTLPLAPISGRDISARGNGDAESIATLPVGVLPNENLEDLAGKDVKPPEASHSSNGKRSILDDDDDPAGWVTLPVTRVSRRDDEDKPFHILPYEGKRSVESQPGLLSLPVIRAAKPMLAKRGAVDVQVENRSDVSYYAQLNIGIPPQKVYAQIDTGSFELWVNPDCTNVRTADQKFCNAIGHYNPRSSSTSKVTSKTAELKYGIGGANITYVLDSISLPGSTAMKRVQFGVADESVDEFSGILGIGAGLGQNTNYKNFIDELDAQGVTNIKAFSLALGSKDETDGVIIFGGVDTSKFQGKLAQLPIIPADQSPDGVARYWVSMDGMALSPPGGSPKNFPNTKMPVFLDSGSTLTLLAPAVVTTIATAIGTQGLGDDGFYTVDCGLANQNGSLNFVFNGVTIKVPYNEIIRSVTGLPPRCYLGIMQSTEFSLLGDTFLRSAYAVFDLSANMTYLAPYSNCGTKLQTINASSDLENMSGTCNAATGGDKPNNGGAQKTTSTITAQPGTFITASSSTSLPTTTVSTGATTTTTPAAASSTTASKDGSQEASKKNGAAGSIILPSRLLGMALVAMVAVAVI